MRIATQALLATGVVALAAGSGSAFTAANTSIPTVAIGQGATTTSGYAVGAVTYTFDTGANADKVTGLGFTLTAAAGMNATVVKARLVAAGAYTDCTPTVTSTTVTTVACTFSSVAASTIDTLDILATRV